jgi:hypothetical protein
MPTNKRGNKTAHHLSERDLIKKPLYIQLHIIFALFSKGQIEITCEIVQYNIGELSDDIL